MISRRFLAYSASIAAIGASASAYEGPMVPINGGVPAILVSATNVITDGVTDNYAIIKSYLSNMPAAGGVIQLPAGNISVNCPDGNDFVVPANVTVLGQGRATTLILNSSTSATKFPFVLNNGSAVRNLSIQSTMTNTSQGGYFLIDGSGCLIEDVYCDGGNPLGQAANNVVHGIYLNTTMEGLTVFNCVFTHVRYGLINTNTNTATLKDIKILNCSFIENEGNDLAFNSPAGVIQGVLVQGCHFRDNQSGTTYSTFGIMCGMASVYDVRIIGNEFFGVCQTDALHIEQDCENVTVTGNVFNLTSSTCNGINVLANNVGGTSLGVDGLSITGNVIFGGGSGGTGHGIWVQNNGQTAPSAIDDTITGNVVKNFNIGIYVESQRKEIVADNIILSCNAGLSGSFPYPAMGNNKIRDCSTGVSFGYGGQLGPIDFQNNSTDVGVVITTNGGRISTTKVSYAFTVISIASGSQSVTVCKAGQSFNGTIIISLINQAAPYQATITATVLWDGTTLTASNQVARSSGGYTIGAAALSVSGGNLVLAATNSTAGALNTNIDATINGAREF